MWMSNCPAPFAEDCYFLRDTSWRLVDNQLAVRVRARFWALGSVPQICVSCHHTSPTVLTGAAPQ